MANSTNRPAQLISRHPDSIVICDEDIGSGGNASYLRIKASLARQSQGVNLRGHSSAALVNRELEQQAVLDGLYECPCDVALL